MTHEDLKLKVINAESKVAKREAIIAKHSAKLQSMIAKGADEYDIQDKLDEIKEADKKLKEAREILDNWKAKLNERISQDEYIEANAPEIIKTFLEAWKEKAIRYYQEKAERVAKLGAELRQKELEARREALRALPELQRMREIYKDHEPRDYDLHNLWPRKAVDNFLRERGLEYSQIQERIRNAGDGVVFRMLDIRDKTERAEWLENEMEKEKRAKLLDLVGRIHRVVGTITDAAGLYISSSGEINGYIEGTEGKAKVETIGAGGYNIQCFHYRTLIHEYK